MEEPAEPVDPEADQPPPADDHAFLGHPRGLATLSGLEVWERFSFLGMQAILVLCFADAVADGGLGTAPGTAATVAAAYGTMVYLVSVAGGWLADRILGSYRALLWGGILIACGHYAMAVPTAATTWTGLGLISAGTGLLKPNAASMVGRPYRTDDEYALAPDAMRRAVHRIVAGLLTAGALATLLAAVGWLTMALWFLAPALANGIQAQVVKVYGQVSAPVYFGVNGGIAVLAGLAVIALAPWLRRTMHPVH